MSMSVKDGILLHQALEAVKAIQAQHGDIVKRLAEVEEEQQRRRGGRPAKSDAPGDA